METHHEKHEGTGRNGAATLNYKEQELSMGGDTCICYTGRQTQPPTHRHRPEHCLANLQHPCNNCNNPGATVISGINNNKTLYSNLTATCKPQSRRRGPNMARGKMYYCTWQVPGDAIMLKRVSKYNVYTSKGGCAP